MIHSYVSANPFIAHMNHTSLIINLYFLTCDKCFMFPTCNTSFLPHASDVFPDADCGRDCIRSSPCMVLVWDLLPYKRIPHLWEG